ncbi:EamA family transporter [Comamonas serinivorans]|uniref:EamA family transporter n=1 Tax=Comamonas serinivorans TaxID=1082851 RepID=A0A1Y0ELQ7_9BURK|nr:DMT family transporter [Comamonas serinivorans]ARU04584.1 EamA family transporter [Comamonas serinivorans]
MSSAVHWAPHLRLLGMVVLWGASWPAGRVVAQAMPPMAAAALRFLMASAVLLIWLHRTRGLGLLRAWDGRLWLGMTAAALTGVFGYALCFLMGLQHLPAGKAALIVTLNPVITLVAASWLFRERINRTIGLGMAIAALGAVIVISHGQPWLLLQGAVGRGELLIVGCVLCWVVYTLLGRWLLVGVDALATTAVTATLGAALLTAASLVVEGPAGFGAALQSGAAAWQALLFLALGATAIAYAWYFDGVKALGAGAAAGYITLVPVVGVVSSALLLGEYIDAATIAGGVLAVAGTALMNRGRR